MFTGIVEAMAPIERLRVSSTGARIELDLAEIIAGIRIGDSIAVNGCCLTVVTISGSLCAFDAVPETISRTTLGERSEGDLVNVERSLGLGDRLGGHLVTGHIDGLGTVLRIEQKGSQWDFTVEVPATLRRYFIEKGSVAIDGISLTVAAVTETGFRVAIIPHTFEVTSMGRLKVGDRVNIETDVMGKWVDRLLSSGRIEGGISLDRLAQEGYVDPGS